MGAHPGFAWNYTTVLNLVALLGFAVLYWLYRHRDTSQQRYAKDPVCGMQVEREHTPVPVPPGPTLPQTGPRPAQSRPSPEHTPRSAPTATSSRSTLIGWPTPAV